MSFLHFIHNDLHTIVISPATAAAHIEQTTGAALPKYKHHSHCAANAVGYPAPIQAAKHPQSNTFSHSHNPKGSTKFTGLLLT